MTTQATEPKLYDHLLSAYELSKDAWNRLQGIRLAMYQHDLKRSFAYGETLRDLACTADTIDVFTTAMFTDIPMVPGHLVNIQLLAIAKRQIRTARMMVACMRHDEMLKDYHDKLGSIHELLRDAYGPLSTY